MLAHFHISDIVTSLHKVSLVAGGREVILYTCLHGTIGILVPFLWKEDIYLLTTLEQHMQTEQLSLVGRNHLAWRGVATMSLSRRSSMGTCASCLQNSLQTNRA